MINRSADCHPKKTLYSDETGYDGGLIIRDRTPQERKGALHHMRSPSEALRAGNIEHQSMIESIQQWFKGDTFPKWLCFPDESFHSGSVSSKTDLLSVQRVGALSL